jgi:hypothetical protein
LQIEDQKKTRKQDTKLKAKKWWLFHWSEFFY